jgi:hypothetical protein
VGSRIERPSQNQRGEREGQLKREADQEGRLDHGHPRDLARMEEPFDEFLGNERERRQENDYGRRRGSPRLTAESGARLQGEPGQQHAEADG